MSSGDDFAQNTQSYDDEFKALQITLPAHHLFRSNMECYVPCYGFVLPVGKWALNGTCLFTISPSIYNIYFFIYSS